MKRLFFRSAPEGRALTGFHGVSTCCDRNIRANRRMGTTNLRTGAVDQILVTRPNLVVEHDIPEELTQSSDHLPVKAKVLLSLD